MSKLFVAELSVTIIVEANSIEDAEDKINRNGYFEEELNGNGSDGNFNIYPINPEYVPHGWNNAIPWGHDENKTVEEILAETENVS